MDVTVKQLLTLLMVLVVAVALAYAAPVDKPDVDKPHEEEENTDQAKVKSPETELHDLEGPKKYITDNSIPIPQVVESDLPKVPQPKENKNNIQSQDISLKRSQNPSLASSANNDIQLGEVKETYEDVDDLYDNINVDLSPRAVAEYILLTGDWDSFDEATRSLIKSGVLSRAEVRQYRDEVGWEYEFLLKELVDAEAAYLQEFIKPLEGAYMAQQQELQGASASSADVMKNIQRLQLDSLVEKENNLNRLLEGVLEDYVSQVATDDSEDNELSKSELEQVIDLVGDVMREKDIQTQEIENTIGENSDVFSAESQLDDLAQQGVQSASEEPNTNSNEQEVVDNSSSGETDDDKSDQHLGGTAEETQDTAKM